MVVVVLCSFNRVVQCTSDHICQVMHARIDSVPSCESIHSSSVSFGRCWHSVVNDCACCLRELVVRLICIARSVISRFVKASAITVGVNIKTRISPIVIFLWFSFFFLIIFFIFCSFTCFRFVFRFLSCEALAAPKIPREYTQEREERIKIVAGEGKKKRGPAEGRSWRGRFWAR